MSTPSQVPLIPSPQTLSISLAGTSYNVTVRWNDAIQAWVMDLATNAGDKILSGIPLVTGEDLLAPFGYLNLGGQLIVQTDNNIDAVPTFTNLGSSGNLFFLTP
jgi:hypothetical protein